MICRRRLHGRRATALAIAAASLVGAHIGAAAAASADEAGVPPSVEETAAALPPPRAVFAGVDRQAHLNLWVTDGTSGGTHELAVAGASPNGLFSSYANEPLGSRIARPEFTALGKKLLFVGNDKAGKLGLWVTNGTLAGTKELAVASANSGGLFYGVDPDFTIFGSKALFAGFSSRTYRDALNRIGLIVGLWVTDGTSAGTSELKVARADPSGLHPGSFVVLGKEVLFAGLGDDHLGPVAPLWVTNGTSAGTKQLTVPGANADGVFEFDNPDFTVLGGRVLFQGADIGQITRFWTTDGTSAGTREVKVPQEVLGDQFGPPQLTVFGRRALFIGHALTQRGASDRHGLWVTNGTVAGTTELNVSGDFARGLFFNGLIPEFTAFRRKVLFAGWDARGRDGLWVTDVTSAGTKRLTVAGASSFGLAPSGFTVFRGKVLFNGLDTKDHFEAPEANLWVTDGTAAGTLELTVSSGALNPTGFAVLGNRALFSGTGHHDLWATDGTAAGTHQVIVPEAWSAGLSPSAITDLP